MFCPKCGSILIPKKIGNKTVMACSSCNFKAKDIKEEKIKETVEETKKVEVIETETNPNPLVDVECPKCKHKKAYFWEIQTRASDEPATQFFKCEKCKHTWRHYD